MKKIVIIGNSLTAQSVTEEFRSNHIDHETLIFPLENTFPCRRDLLWSLPLKKTGYNKFFYRQAEDYQKDGIKFIFDKKITRINFKRSRLTLDDKEHADYDILLLSDMFLPPFFGVKGANKTGLYHARLMSDMSQLVKQLPLIETVIVQSDGLAGFKLALAISETKKETILVTSGEDILNGLLSREDAAVLAEAAQQTGLRVLTRCEIVEILGDTEVKALRLSTGKVYSCQAILTDADWPDLRILKDTELQYSQRVLVNKFQQTNFENVFALDGVCDRIHYRDWDVSQNYLDLAREQAQGIVAGLTGTMIQHVKSSLIWEISYSGQIIQVSVSRADEQNPFKPILTIRREDAADKQKSCINA